MMRFLRRIAAMLRPAVEVYDDPTFGPLRRMRGGSWHGEIPFHHPSTTAMSLSVLIEAGEGHPTEAQRALFREILGRYAELWPLVAEALANGHPAYKTTGDVAEHIDDPCVCLDLLADGQPRRWGVQYTFDDPNEGDMGYFVDFCEWEIVGVSAAD